MFSTIRKHLTYTNVVLTLALVFAMSGGAYAAGKYVITSTKQISPKVLKTLKGANGAPGAQGPQGAAGAAGAKGETGSTGTEGKTGPEGKAGANGTSVTSKEVPAPGCTNKQGGSEFTTTTGTKTFACNGKEGSPWTAGGTLPKNSTETGVWTEPQGIEYPTHKPQFVYAQIGFPIPLTGELEESKVHFIKPSETPPPGCNGSVTKPEAESGNLCVYASTDEGINDTSFVNPEQASGPATAGRTGTLISFELPESEETSASVHGTWAVTG